MTTTIPTTALRPVVVDLYRDIHKGIRTQLFAATEAAGRLDPADGNGRRALARQVADLVTLLVTHAEHEDGAIQPELERHLPDLAERVEVEHLTLESRIERLEAQAREAVDADPAVRRHRVHGLYVDLAGFTSAYLAHQDLEERVIMPALEDAIGPEAVLGVHQAIISAIPPDELAASLAIMLPAMNVDDRTELLGGMQAGAPSEVFEGVWALAGSVLPASDVQALAARLARG